MSLVVRTEAAANIGIGHFMRCFAIAEQVRLEGKTVLFLTGDLPPQAQARLKSLGIAHRHTPYSPGSEEDRAFVLDNTKKQDVLLLDSYAFSADYYRQLYEQRFTVVMDDCAEVLPLHAHVVINAAMRAKEMGYQHIAPQAQLLLGPAYAPIRDEFRRYYASPLRPQVCITFGGSDPLNFTGIAALHLLALVPECDIRLIVGPLNEHLAALSALSAAQQQIKVYPCPANSAEVLYQAEMVITAAGGSLYEIAAMGLPALVLVTADNQAGALSACPYPALDARTSWPNDFALCCNKVLQHTQLGKDAQRLVDGNGCKRIVQAMPL